MKNRSIFAAVLIGSALFLRGSRNLLAESPKLEIRGPSYEENLERWNKLTEEEKAGIIKNYEKWKSFSPSQQGLIQKRYSVFRTLSNEQRDILKRRAAGRAETPIRISAVKSQIAREAAKPKTPSRPQSLKQEQLKPKMEDRKERMERPERPVRLERQGRDFNPEPFERREMPERTLRPGRN